MRNSILYSIFIWWLYCSDHLTVMCYKIPQVQFTTLDNGFRVSIPHEDGISRVIYNIEINQQCPLILDLITEQKNKLWTSTQSSRQLHVNDEVKINVMVKYNNALFTRTDIAHISKTLPYTITSVKSGDNPIDVCNFNGWKEQTIDPDRNSMTKVILKKQPSGKSYKPNELIFQENFQKLDTTVWSYDLFMHSNAIGDRSEEFTMFTDDKDNISVKDNKLSITPLISQRQRDGIYNITGCTGAPCYENREETCIYKRDGSRHFKYPAPVDSAKISTKDSFSFTYGRIEIRAKLPEGDWLFPYIMLQPDKLNCTTRKQLRIAYATSKDLEAFRIRGGPVILNAKFNPISKGYVFDRTSHMVFHTGIEPSKYHNFTLIWTSEQIALFVDNDKYGCISNNGQYTESYNIVLGVSAGGHLEYAEPISKPWLNSDNSAPLTFHQSFTDCCERNFGKRECTQTVKPSCSRKKKLDCNQMEPTYEKRTCSQPWGPQSNMSVEYVRVYAV